MGFVAFRTVSGRRCRAQTEHAYLWSREGQAGGDNRGQIVAGVGEQRGGECAHCLNEKPLHGLAGARTTIRRSARTANPRKKRKRAALACLVAASDGVLPPAKPGLAGS